MPTYPHTNTYIVSTCDSGKKSRSSAEPADSGKRPSSPNTSQSGGPFTSRPRTVSFKEESGIPASSNCITFDALSGMLKVFATRSISTHRTSLHPQRRCTAPRLRAGLPSPGPPGRPAPPGRPSRTDMIPSLSPPSRTQSERSSWP